MIESDKLEVSEPVELDLSASLQTSQAATPLENGQQVRYLPSYRPTPWKFVNALLDMVDNYTGGRAGLLQRFFTFAFIGGAAALVNLLVFYVVLYRIDPQNRTVAHNVLASVFASEISIMANFIPNDYFTFSHLPGHERSWVARCARFHLTSVVGSLLTFLIEFGFSYVGHVPAILSQATALIIVLFYNFSFHHIFTYGRVKTAPEAI
ncbi:MAG TPA: GtrA family protein [Ktedonobacteraceae bacterium]|nr:GtrA family protein [Ktedonobacteraceae bacterium]